jgi:hypothetical protein
MRIMTKKEWMEYLENTWDAAQKEAWAEHSEREWVGLTEEQLEQMWEADATSPEDCDSLYYYKKIARQVEAKLKERNG